MNDDQTKPLSISSSKASFFFYFPLICRWPAPVAINEIFVYVLWNLNFPCVLFPLDLNLNSVSKTIFFLNTYLNKFIIYSKSIIKTYKMINQTLVPYYSRKYYPIFIDCPRYVVSMIRTLLPIEKYKNLIYLKFLIFSKNRFKKNLKN